MKLQIVRTSPAFLAAVLIGAAVAIPARAERVACAERQDVLDFLASKYDEEPRVMALTKRGLSLEITASPDGGTWTLLLTGPDGRTCAIDSGRGITFIAPQEPGEGA